MPTLLFQCMGFRGIERFTGVHHAMVISWVTQAGEVLLDIAPSQTISALGELD